MYFSVSVRLSVLLAAQCIAKSFALVVAGRVSTNLCRDSPSVLIGSNVLLIRRYEEGRNGSKSLQNKRTLGCLLYSPPGFHTKVREWSGAKAGHALNVR